MGKKKVKSEKNKEKKNNNSRKIIVIIVAVLLFGGFIGALFLRRDDPVVLVMDNVTDAETNFVIEKQIDIQFGKIEERKDGIYVEYTMENLTKKNLWVNLEVKAYDSEGKEIGEGFINLDSIKSGTVKTDEFIVDLTTGTKEELEKGSFKVTKAYSEAK